MNLKIDMRETELIKQCQILIETVPKFSALTIAVENLYLGDIVINNGISDCIIIERKSLRDLAASIKDGRYAEQSYRLNGIDHHNHNIIYLFEGDVTTFNTFKERVDKQTLYSAMFSINYFKGFSIMRSINISETAVILCNMAIKLGSDPNRQSYYSDRTKLTTETSETPGTETEDNSKQYCSVVKKRKKENITNENIGEIMLCQIPGVSNATALAIFKEFQTLPKLVECIKENEHCMNNIVSIDKNGKQRKISKAAITTIVSFLKS